MRINNLHNIYKKYIKIKKNILSDVEEYFSTLNGRVLGVQYRYTDKKKEVCQISDDDMVKMILTELPNYDFIFVATDYQPLIDKLSILSNKIKYLPSKRSSNDIGSHFQKNDRVFDNYQKGYEILKEIMILSKCDDFFYSRSNVSLSVLIINNLKFKKIKCINENRLCNS